MKKLFYSLCAILAIVACSGNDVENGGTGGGQTPPKQPQITLNATAADFTTEGGSNTITFTSTDAWTAEIVNNRADDWCWIEPTSGPAGNAQITVTTTANDTPDERTASVIIKAGTASKTVKVSQKQKDALTVTSSKFEVGAEGGEVIVEVKANIDFEYTIDEAAKEWIQYEGTRAMKTSTLKFAIAQNEDTEKREGKIAIKSGEFNEVVTIYQAGDEPSIVISKNEYIVASAGETIAVEVKSNVDVAVEIPSDAGWISENTTRGISTNTYYFDIDENVDYDQRSAEIKFTNKANSLSEVVTIVQSQKDAIVLAKSEYEFGIDGGNLDFEIQTNVDITVTISDNAKSWITQVETRALETKTLHFDIAACVSEEDREGIITISGGNAKQTIKVMQIVPYSRILYTSTEGKVIIPNEGAFGGAEIVSNVYENGQGVITFDRRVSEIHMAFDDCISLESISLPKEVKTIGNSAFYGCIFLTSVVVSGVTEIGDDAFSWCTSLANITLPESIMKIGDRAFDRCTSLVSINLPESLTEIGDDAFYWCTSLASVNLPMSLTKVGDRTFAYCASLVNVTFPDVLIEIGDDAFFWCTSLTGVNLPEGLTKIGESAFSNCTSWANITIPERVMKIGKDAFSNCTSFTEIIIPKNVNEIGEMAFSGCSSLKSIVVDSNNKVYDSRNNSNAIIHTESNTLIAGFKNTIIPESVVEIGQYAFAGCTSLTEIVIPKSVTNIGNYAFIGCTSLANIILPEGLKRICEGVFVDCATLTNIILPESLTEIEGNAFMYCSSLVSITIPDSVISIGGLAFYNCYALNNVSIGNGATSIGNRAFDECHSLDRVYCKPIIPPSLGVNVFDTPTIYVPNEGLTSYQSNSAWNVYTIEGYDF